MTNSNLYRIQSQEQISDSIYRIRIKAPKIVKQAKPGQFVHLRVQNSIHPLLRRPFSIHQIDLKEESFSILYRDVGIGTKLMSSLKSDDLVDVIGPLGNGFDLVQPFREAVIVAGGMGSAPVFFLIDALLQKQINVTLLWGVKEKSELFDLDLFDSNRVRILCSTEDGSYGECGYVTALLSDFINSSKNHPDVMGFVCGPECMIEEVQKYLNKSTFPWQASLEERMACGVGVCQGCPIQFKSGEYQMVCSDGPVFDLKDIEFHD